MDDKYWITFAGFVLPPLCGFFANCGLRGSEALKGSSTDWLLVLWVFDLTALFTFDDFVKLIANPVYQRDALPIFLTLGIVTFVLWWLVGRFVEPRLRAEVEPGLAQLGQRALFILSYAAAIGITICNTYVMLRGA